MTEQEMISALQTVLKPLSRQVEDMSLKLDEMQIQINTLRLEMKSTERSIRRDIRELQDGQETLIAVLEAKGILPKVVE